MFYIHCPQCERSHLVGTGSIVSLHNTSEGVIAYVKCPEGHITVNTGTPRSMEKAAAGEERSLDPVRKSPALAGTNF